MIGIWKSGSDLNFTREFKANGTFINRNSGDKSTQTGTWKIIDASNVKDLDLNSLGYASIVELKTGKQEPKYIAIKSVTESTLTIIDISGKVQATAYYKQ